MVSDYLDSDSNSDSDSDSDSDEEEELLFKIIEEYTLEYADGLVADFEPTKKKRVIRNSRTLDYSKTKWGVLLKDQT